MSFVELVIVVWTNVWDIKSTIKTVKYYQALNSLVAKIL